MANCECHNQMVTVPLGCPTRGFGSDDPWAGAESEEARSLALGTWRWKMGTCTNINWEKQLGLTFSHHIYIYKSISLYKTIRHELMRLKDSKALRYTNIQHPTCILFWANGLRSAKNHPSWQLQRMPIGKRPSIWSWRNSRGSRACRYLRAPHSHRVREGLRRCPGRKTKGWPCRVWCVFSLVVTLVYKCL